MTRNTHDRLEEHVGALWASLVELSSSLSGDLPAGASLEDAIRSIHERLLAREDTELGLGSFRGDAWIESLGFTGDAILHRARSGSFTAGAWIGPDKGIIADAIIRKAIAGSFTGDAVISAEEDEVELAYVEDTAGMNVTSTDFTAPNLWLETDPIVFDGTTRVKVEAFMPNWRPATGTTGRRIEAALWIDEEEWGVIAWSTTPATGNNDGKPMYASAFITPAAGTRTISVRCIVSAGTGVIFAGDGSGPDLGTIRPGWLRVTSA